MTTRIYLDSKPKAAYFDRFVMTRDVGNYVVRDGRYVVIADALVPELYDALVYAHGELVDEQGGARLSGPQLSLVALLSTVSKIEKALRAADPDFDDDDALEAALNAVTVAAA